MTWRKRILWWKAIVWIRFGKGFLRLAGLFFAAGDRVTRAADWAARRAEREYLRLLRIAALREG